MGPRVVWKDTQHPLRHHPSLQLTGIPTLVHWSNGAPAGKLGPELEAAGSAKEADGLIRDFIMQHETDQASVDVHAHMLQLHNKISKLGKP